MSDADEAYQRWEPSQPQAEESAFKAGYAAALRDLEALTPGGSEFAGDPARYLAHIHRRLATFGKLAAERNRLRKAVEGIIPHIESLPEDAFGFHAGDDGYWPYRDEFLHYLRRALEAKEAA